MPHTNPRVSTSSSKGNVSISRRGPNARTEGGSGGGSPSELQVRYEISSACNTQQQTKIKDTPNGNKNAYAIIIEKPLDTLR